MNTSHSLNYYRKNNKESKLFVTDLDWLIARENERVRAWLNDLLISSITKGGDAGDAAAGHNRASEGPWVLHRQEGHGGQLPRRPWPTMESSTAGRRNNHCESSEGGSEWENDKVTEGVLEREWERE